MELSITHFDKRLVFKAFGVMLQHCKNEILVRKYNEEICQKLIKKSLLSWNRLSIRKISQKSSLRSIISKKQKTEKTDAFKHWK